LDLFREQEWHFAPDLRATVPGSPGFAHHPLRRRIIYGITSLIIGLTCGFSNALLSANLPYLRGALGLETYEIAWLPTVYAIMNCLGGGLLFKYRQQFGARSFAIIFLFVQLAVIGAHLLVREFGSAIIVRAASGLTATALTTLCIFYMLQAFPLQHRPKAIVLSVGIPQLGVPLARLLPLDALALSKWQGLYLLEFGLSALSLACVLAFRLPPSVKQRVFERRDFVSMALYSIAIACFGSAIGMGPYLWWWDRDWVGWSLAACLPLFAITVILETKRKAPLIDIRWLTGADLVRLAIVLIMTRIVLSEQSTGAIGFLRLFGLVNENFFNLSLVIAICAFAGPIAAAMLIKPERIPVMVMVALLLVAMGSYLDSHSSDLTRAPQFFFTQGVIAFSATFFIGPALLYGVARVLAADGQKLSSFVIMFSITQSMGSLLGNALLQTAQILYEHDHSARLIVSATMLDPLVASNVVNTAAGYSAVIADPAQRTGLAVQSVAQQLYLEASILAFNDTFRLLSILSLLTATGIGCLVVYRTLFLKHRKSE
jgi:hypothetical protein